MHNKPADKAADVFAEQGEVLVEGPDGISYSFTPGAALETSDRLLHGGMKAEGQLAKAKLQKRITRAAHEQPPGEVAEN